MAEPDIVTTRRRVAVLLGSGSSCRRVLDALLPLLENEEGVELEGVFLEESELDAAAGLPFVREVCRLTLTVRDFRPSDARRTAAARLREAQRYLADTATQMGAAHSIRSARGPALRLLRETLESSDITFFEPARLSALRLLGGDDRPGPARRRVAVVIDQPASAASLVRTAWELARRRPERVAILLSPAAAKDAAKIDNMLPGGRRIVDRLEDHSMAAVIAAAKRVGAGALVLPASEALLAGDNLRALQEELSCPVVVVRQPDAVRASDDQQPSA